MHTTHTYAHTSHTRTRTCTRHEDDHFRARANAHTHTCTRHADDQFRVRKVLLIPTANMKAGIKFQDQDSVEVKLQTFR